MIDNDGSPFESERNIGARIFRLRTERRMTQRELAGSKYSTAYVSKVEHGKAKASFEMRQWCAKQLQVPLAELLGDDDPPSLYVGSQRQRLAESGYQQSYAEMLVSAGEAQAAAVQLRALQKKLGASLPKTLLWLNAYLSCVEGDLDSARSQLQTYGPPASGQANPLERAAYHWLKGMIANADKAYAVAVEEHQRAITSGSVSHIAPDFAIGARASLVETLLNAHEYERAYDAQTEIIQLYDLVGNPMRHAEDARRLAEQAAAAHEFVNAYRLTRWADVYYREARSMRTVFAMCIRHALMQAPAGQSDQRERDLTLALTIAQRLEDARKRELATALLVLLFLDQNKVEHASLRAFDGLSDTSEVVENRPAVELALLLLARAALEQTESQSEPANERLEQIEAAIAEANADPKSDLFLLVYAHDATLKYFKDRLGWQKAYKLLHSAIELTTKHGLSWQSSVEDAIC